MNDEDMLDENILVGSILDRSTLDGNILDGNILDGNILDGNIFDGSTLDGNIPDENILDETLIDKTKKIEDFKLAEGMVKNEIKQCVGKINFLGKKGTCSFVVFKQMNFKFKFILTNNHVISKEFLESCDEIVIEICEIEKKINLKKERFIYSNEKMDFTIIQILESDFIDKYLEIDNSFWKSNYKDEDIFSLHFPHGKGLKYGTGEIKKIKNGLIAHNISTKRGSSGAPLILTNHKIIGIHKGVYKKDERKSNIGIFIKDIVMKIIEDNQNLVKENTFEVLFYQSIKCILKLKKYSKNLLPFFIFLILFSLSSLFFIYIPLKKKKSKRM